MLVSLKELMADAEEKGYAVGAFNAVNLESLIAIIAAAEETKSISHLVSRSHRSCRSTASASLSPSICRLRASEWPDLAAGES